jgi:ArsR family transcriptional regulator, arsenate/arsenite/antimonite-responsive transcriptional repressor
LIIIDVFTIVNRSRHDGHRTNTDQHACGRVVTGPRAGAAPPVVWACCPSVLAAPLDAEEAAELARGFTALADPVRLRVLSMLAASEAGEVCVCDFVDPLGKSQPTISHHLKILSEAGLVTGDRRGKWVWYSLDRGRLDDLRSAIAG